MCACLCEHDLHYAEVMRIFSPKLQEDPEAAKVLVELLANCPHHLSLEQLQQLNEQLLSCLEALSDHNNTQQDRLRLAVWRLLNHLLSNQWWVWIAIEVVASGANVISAPVLPYRPDCPDAAMTVALSTELHTSLWPCWMRNDLGVLKEMVAFLQGMILFLDSVEGKR